jgi:hypothetical protein
MSFLLQRAPTGKRIIQIKLWYRDQVAKHMTPEQIAEAQKLAREWKPKQ